MGRGRGRGEEENGLHNTTIFYSTTTQLWNIGADHKLAPPGVLKNRRDCSVLHFSLQITLREVMVSALMNFPTGPCLSK